LHPPEGFANAADENPNRSLPWESSLSADEFQVLEQKIRRAVEIVRRERELRAAAESEAASLREQLDSLLVASNEAQTQITALHQEREAVRGRVERLLRQVDELL
jgi:chromosome segregation ATPase